MGHFVAIHPTLQNWLGSEEGTPGSKAGPRKSLESKQQMPECLGYV